MRYSFEDNLATLLQLRSQRRTAEEIGINSRTLERWLVGAYPKPASQEKVRIAAIKARATLKKRAKAEGYEPIRTKVPVYGERRMLKVYDKKGKDTGQEKDSEWVNYRVDRLTFEQCLDVLQQFRNMNDPRMRVQFIFMAVEGTESDGSRYAVSGQHISSADEEVADDFDYPQWERFGSTIESLTGMNDIDLRRLLRTYYRGYYRPGRINIQYICVIQP